MQQDNGSTPPDETFFRALETRRARALVARDMAVLEALHAPEYQLITPSGKVFGREAYLAAVAAEPFYAGWEVGETVLVRASAQMALIRYQARLNFPSGRELLCWHMDSYERRTAGWQAVWSQATQISGLA